MNYTYRNLILIPILIILAMIAGALIGRGIDNRSEICFEDMPCWNCEEMGNQICGDIP